MKYLLAAILFLFVSSAFSQNDISLALRNPNHKAPSVNNSNTIEVYSSRFFCDALTGTTGIVKSFLNSPSNFAWLSTSTRSLFGAARGTNGVYYAVEHLAIGSGNLVSIDTSNGNINTIASLTGLGTGHVLTGLALDKTTNTMYVSSVDGASGRLYTINLTTGALTTVAASMTGSTYPIDIAINNTGTMYTCDVNTDALYTVNKTTGAATLVGSLGININFAQGMAFDPDTDSLFLAAYTDAGRLYRCNTSTGVATLIGSFGSSGNEVDAFIIPPSVNRQLNAFNLQLPIAGARIVSIAGSTTPVTISWDTSGAGASYKFIFGNPVTPPRRFPISSSINSIIITLGELDNLLAANGFTNNGSATDSAVGQWDVWAYKGSGAPGADSLKAGNGPRAITFRRQQQQLNPFVLSSPASGVTIITSPIDTSKINFVWRNSGSGNTYKWLFKNSLSYSDPASIRLLSNSIGFDTVVSIRNSYLDSAISILGIAAGDSITGVWRVRAFSSSDSLNSISPDRQITFRRTGLLPLDQKFSETNFPPLFWSLQYSGTLYWSRETPSAYGAGVGSARFKCWSAEIGTTQSLISNQFPPVPNNLYGLTFDYAYRYYLDGGGILANDSMGVFTSTDNGTTWNLLKTIKATQTPQLGINSSDNLTTASGSGEFTSPANGEWAAKVFALPVNTNKVKFTVWSGYGNNIFIDNVLSFIFVDANVNHTGIPTEYKLNQNYPNPFNPVTKINFSIPKTSFVTLKIFDIVGREVKTLVSETLQANEYNVSFDASALPSGVYFYRLQSGEFSEIKKMILLK